jgi:uncharacterized protein YndB with AHSA1/START domain
MSISRAAIRLVDRAGISAADSTGNGGLVDSPKEFTKLKNTETLKLTTPSDREVVLTRVFDAPRKLVFEACTVPALLKRWMEAPGRAMEVCEIDLKVGGAYRFVWRGPGKPEVGMHGVYREVEPPERFVRTEAWEDWDAGEVLVTTDLIEDQGKTTLTSTVLFPSREVRDAVLKAGMEHGAADSFDKLDEYLVSVVSK